MAFIDKMAEFTITKDALASEKIHREEDEEKITFK
jgi:hypothetical protein